MKYNKYSKSVPNATLKSKAIDFENMSKVVRPYFDEINAPLGFAGYKKTLNDYIYSETFDIDGLFKLTKELVLWMNYIGEVLALTENLYLIADNKRRYYESFEILPSQTKEYEALKEVQIRHSRLALYIKHLEIQYKMFKSCFYTVNNIYNESIGSLIYRSYD